MRKLKSSGGCARPGAQGAVLRQENMLKHDSCRYCLNPACFFLIGAPVICTTGSLVTQLALTIIPLHFSSNLVNLLEYVVLFHRCGRPAISHAHFVQHSMHHHQHHMLALQACNRPHDNCMPAQDVYCCTKQAIQNCMPVKPCIKLPVAQP